MRLMEISQVKRIIEAALLAAGQPLSVVQLTALFGEGEPIGAETVAQALSELQAECAERGVELIEVASGFRYQVRADVHAWVARLWTERQTKYSRALLETLALIAYRQPITRAEIEQIRGVAVSSNIIRTLEEREWVRVVGHRDVPGRPALFGTTRQFLDYFSLKSLDELPPLAEIRDLEELEPQLDLPAPIEDGTPVAAVALDGDASADGASTPEARALASLTPGADASDGDSTDTNNDIDSSDATTTDDIASDTPDEASDTDTAPPIDAEPGASDEPTNADLADAAEPGHDDPTTDANHPDEGAEGADVEETRP